MTAIAQKFTGPAITSVLALSVVKPDPAQLADPRSVMFTNLTDAIAWRETLTGDQLEYFNKIDRFIITMEPGRIVDLKKKVKPEDWEHFFHCLSFLILACDLFGDISFNDDFTLMKLNHKWEPVTTFQQHDF